MARILLGIGTSHTPMLNAPPSDWLRFIERDHKRAHLDKTGRAVSYDELLALADPQIEKELAAEVIERRHGLAMAAIAKLATTVRDARLDVLIVIGDDQKELFGDGNMPAILLYRGQTIRNVPLTHYDGPEWARRASARYYEPNQAREYPAHPALAKHLIERLIEDFDLSCADGLPQGLGEGHAFGFVHNRLLAGIEIPVVPVFLNTYYPPNQPTPARCYKLGQAIRHAVEAFSDELRVGILASGGLSHFTVNEEFDGQVIHALKHKDAAALASLPPQLLNAGNSEIRNWICLAGAVESLAVTSIEYIPAYRTPAGTGTGLCFAVWQ